MMRHTPGKSMPFFEIKFKIFPSVVYNVIDPTSENVSTEISVIWLFDISATGEV